MSEKKVKARKCEGKRRMWRGRTNGIYKCGRNATHRVETRVGMTEQHYVCDGEECFRTVTSGYPAHSFAL